MPAARKKNWGRSILLSGCALGAWGWIVVGTAHAQSADPGKNASPSVPAAAVNQAGGLDMDINPTAPAAAASQSQPGGLDMDVNPTTPAPAPVVASTPTIQDLSHHNVQDGIRTAPMEPGPDQASSIAGQPQPSPIVATPAAQPEPVNLDHPTVVDTADLKAGDKIVALYGIEGMQGDAAQGLQGFLSSTDGHLTCQAQTSSGSVCLLADGTDVAEVALVNGAARAKDDAPDAYRDQEAAAQAARRGIWANLPPPPVAVKSPVVQDTATLMADGQTYVLNGVLGLGAPYASQLQGYIAANGNSLSCQPQIEPGQYICMMNDGTDVAKVALVNGAARVSPEAPDSYRVQQADALSNHRGLWLNPPPDVLLAGSAVQAVPVCCALEPGDDGVDGITYVGGVPEAVIDGESVFLVFGGAIGWGYYDHWHHWQNAPDRYRRHLDHFHAEGHGLRGYGHDEVVRRDAVLRHDEALHHDAALHHDVALNHEATLNHEAALHHDVALNHEATLNREAALHSTGMHEPGLTGHPGMAPTAMHTAAGVHPGTPAPMGHPGSPAGGFVHPGPSAGGFHPSGVAMAHAAPAPAHVSAPAPAVKKK